MGASLCCLESRWAGGPGGGLGMGLVANVQPSPPLSRITCTSPGANAEVVVS